MTRGEIDLRTLEAVIYQVCQVQLQSGYRFSEIIKWKSLKNQAFLFHPSLIIILPKQKLSTFLLSKIWSFRVAVTMKSLFPWKEVSRQKGNRHSHAITVKTKVNSHWNDVALNRGEQKGRFYRIILRDKVILKNLHRPYL